MAPVKRLNKVTTEFNVGISTIVEFLASKGVEIEASPNTKITEEHYSLLLKEFSSDSKVKRESDNVDLSSARQKKETISIKEEKPVEIFNPSVAENELAVKIVGKIDLSPKKKESPAPEAKPVEPAVKTVEKIVENPAAELPKAEPVAKEKEPELPQKTVSATPPVSTPKTVAPVVAPSAPIVEAESAQTPASTEPDTDSGHISHSQTVENNVKVVGRIDLSMINQKTRPDKKSKEEKQRERQEKHAPRSNQNTQANPNRENRTDGDVIRAKSDRLAGPTVVGKIDLPKKPETISSAEAEKRKRKRIKKSGERVSDNKFPNTSGPGARPAGTGTGTATSGGAPGTANRPYPSTYKGKGRFEPKPEITGEDVQKKVKETLSRLTAKSKNKGVKHRRDKREAFTQRQQLDEDRANIEKSILRVTEFISVSDVATMMDIPVNKVIGTCMSLGLFVSINQRLDAETIALITEEFGYKVEFTSIEIQEAIEQEADKEEDLLPRPPIVTVMGHVDHGKTSLLDYVRRANVIAGEAGGITQHIGAYSVELDNGKKITFLDTPGHEAFTAMRARGAQVTDIAIIVIAADDSVMPQTIEAINHASAAGVPIVFALNKVDKETANPDKIREALSAMNYLVEEWGGKFQSQEISAKFGKNMNELLEKVLLEAEMLELKANPNKSALGTVIESELDKGRGYVSTVLIEAGTLKVGDYLLAGKHTGKVKAMFNVRNMPVETAGPSDPVIVLGLNGAPQAGDRFNVMATEREAKEIANKREQLQREQDLKTQKHVTLDEIGRRIAIGNFQQLNLIVKGDVDGSIEALTDSLIKLSTEEIQVNVIHKAVGQITESDVLLAAASDAIVIGFQVRPSTSARKLADQEGIDVRLYSIIYDAINEIKDAMSGMLSPEIKEEIVGTAEIQETFKITKIGTIAGCIVQNGKIKRNNKIRIIREGIVIYTGDLGSLKRFKDDVKEVTKGYECGLNINNFNDLEVGDTIEAFEQVEYARTLK